MKIKKMTPYFLLMVSVVAVAFAVILVRLSEVDPSATLMWRMFLSFALLLPTCFWPRKKKNENTEAPSIKHWALLLFSSALFALDLLANHWAVMKTSVANTSLLMNLSPLFVFAISCLFLKEKIRLGKFVFMGVILFGGSLLIRESMALQKETLLGDGLAVLSAFFYALYLLFTKYLRESFKSTTIILVNSLVCWILLAPVVFLTSDPLLPVSLNGFLMIAGLAIISQIFGHGLMAYAIKSVNVSFAALTSLLRPFMAIFLAWIFLHETMSFAQWFGGAIIILGLYGFNRSDRSVEKEKADPSIKERPALKVLKAKG